MEESCQRDGKAETILRDELAALDERIGALGDLVQPKRDFSKIEMQAIIAFGPPGEYGEETVKVPVDHGHPWVYELNAKPF